MANSRGFVYFIECPSQGLIKIGYAAKPEARFYSLITMNAADIRRLATMGGGRVKEAELHIRFAHLRVHGEWFRAESELMDFIISEANGWGGKELSRRKRLRKHLIPGTDLDSRCYITFGQVRDHFGFDSDEETEDMLALLPKGSWETVHDRIARPEAILLLYRVMGEAINTPD